MELLIVDDEESALQAVLQNVKWDSLPYGQVYTASNIERAKQHLDNLGIKVILCDIEMPMGSGMELLEWINENKRDVICIFMTCHAEFSYAQQAVRLGSFDYVLKPLDFSALTKTLLAAAERVQLRTRNYAKLEKAKSVVEQQFWRQLFIGEISLNRAEIQDYLRRHEIDLPIEGRFLPGIVALDFRNKEMSTEDRKLNVFALRNMCEELLYSENADMMIETTADDRLLIIFRLQEPVAEELFLEEVQNKFQLLDEAVRKYLQFFPTGIFAPIAPIEQIPEEIESIYDMFYYLWQQYLMGNIGYDIRTPFLTTDYRAELPEYENAERTQPVEQVISYIKEHLGDEISVETIAAQVFLNSDYLNRIFKRATGKTVSNYLIEQRIERAKYLLQNSGMSIGEVAGRVGYYNYSSFNRSFKKVTGKSPQEWKTGK